MPRILIIEDEIKTATYLSEGLKSSGYIVSIARDGKEGLFLATLEGPGTVWVQSLTLSRLAQRINGSA